MWEPRGERLVVGWSGGGAGGGTDGGAGAAGVCVVATRVSPSFTAHALGHVSNGPDGAALRALQFAYAFEGRGGAGAAGSGAMLSVGWRDGQMSLVPLVF